MSNIELIRHLERALYKAARSHDWAQVRHVDNDIATLLTALRDTPISPALNAALMALKATHHTVGDYCQTQHGRLKIKMAKNLRNREGAAAYATFMDEGAPE